MQRMSLAIEWTLLVVLLAAFPVAAEEEDGAADFEGSVEFVYRNVSQDGSTQKYNEDFDGLESGVYLSSLAADWNNFGSKQVDFLRLEASGLGGEPFERATLRMGRKDSYEFSVSHRKQEYLYNLFGLVDDLDGSTWDSKRRLTDVDLTLHATDTIDLFFGFQEVQRSGTSLFMKQVNADLFRLETPLDQGVKRYSLGGRFRIGRADLLLRQWLRRYDYRFNNMTDGDPGISVTDLASLDLYDWRQNDTGGADLTTLKISLPLSHRVSLTASVFGTLLGDDEISSRVSLDAEGTSFRGRCSVTNDVCDPGNPCDTGVPGNVCVADAFSVADGSSMAEIEADHLLLDADLTVVIAEPVDLHFRVQSLDREITGHHLRDLDGNGVPDDTEGTVNDDTPGSTTRVDYSLDSITGSFDWEVSPKLRLRAGYRTIQRELERSGFEYGATDYRNTDFESDSDDTIIAGVVLKPAPWVRLSGDYEKGDIAQAFNAVAPTERDYLRLRAKFTPQSDMRVDLSYSDYENENDGVDFREAGDCGAPGSDIDNGCWNSQVAGTTYAASFWHKASTDLDYWLRWARQETDSVIRFRYDTDFFFNSAENGNSVYQNTSNEWAAQINFSWVDPWRAFLRARINDSDGDNDILGPTLTNRLIIDQDYSDVEAGVTYTFTSNLYVGGRFRVFDYDDVNDRLDYDGEIFSIVAGLGF